MDIESVLPKSRSLPELSVISTSVKMTVAKWEGEIRPRLLTNQEVSQRVFIGWSRIVPHNILMKAFARFGLYKYYDNNKTGGKHCYLDFQSSDSVQAMIHCAHKCKGGLYFNFLYEAKLEHIQIIPWFIQDSAYINPNVTFNFRNKSVFNTIFIGAIHALLTANAIAEIFEQCFGEIAFVDIRCDENRYPVGCGTVTFTQTASCRRAVTMGAVDVLTSKFGRRITIDPFVRISSCSVFACDHLGNVFCKNCFNYFCIVCFQSHPLSHVGVDVISFCKK